MPSTLDLGQRPMAKKVKSTRHESTTFVLLIQCIVSNIYVYIHRMLLSSTLIKEAFFAVKGVKAAKV